MNVSKQPESFTATRTFALPKFPGHADVISTPSLPENSSAQSMLLSHDPLPSLSEQHLSKSRGKQTTAACRPCRKRKSKCDGGRPSCKTCSGKMTRCTYSVEEGQTQQQASREQLKAYKCVVKMLRAASPGDTAVILQQLREHDDIKDAVRFLHTNRVLVAYPTINAA